MCPITTVDSSSKDFWIGHDCFQNSDMLRKKEYCYDEKQMCVRQLLVREVTGSIPWNRPTLPLENWQSPRQPALRRRKGETERILGRRSVDLGEEE